MTDKKIPFVGLHAHSVAGSIFDAMGYPNEHMDFCYENGGEALALTDHGNMNGLPHQLLHIRKMKAEGKDFKPIYGCEAYFIPSIEEWREEYDRAKADVKAAKTLAKSGTTGATVEDEGTSKKEMKSVLNRRRHLVLLAQNQTGLTNLFKLISESYKEENFYRYPRMDYAMLAKYSEGIIASSACLGGPLAGDFWANSEYEEVEETGRSKWVRSNPDEVRAAMRETTRRFVEIFGDRWYGELQWNSVPEQHELNQYIIEVCEEFCVELISTADSHYPNPEAWKDRELYKRLGWMGKAPSWGTTELPVDVEEVGYELYPKNGEQMWDSYKHYSALCKQTYNDELVMDSITRTHKIAFERIETFEPNTEVKLPDFVVPAGQTATQALISYSLEGLRERNLGENKEYMSRLKYELGVIDDRGFSKYFLTMKSIVDQALETMLTGPGRGSACGSLVAYVLNITQIDPIKYDLPFERFLRSDATDYPDIDTDVSAPMALKEKLIEEWGANSVVPISNWNTLQLKSLIKDISKFYEVPYGEVNKVTTAMMDEAVPAAKIKHGIKAGVYAPTWEEVMELSPSLRGFLVKYPHIKTHVEALVGQVRSVSRHAGGVLVADDLNEHMPIISSGGVRQSPWAEGQNVRHLEPLGFIKFDLLGLSTLKMFEGCIEHILRRHHGVEECTFEQIRDYYDRVLHPDILDLNDSAVYKHVFHKGNFAGTFQFTGDGAADFCKNVRPNNIAEISAVTSIFRPGPLSARVNDAYVAAKEGNTDIEWYHPIFKEITEETYGHIIYQEQISELTHRIGKNISRDDGNTIRKLLTKSGTGKEHLLTGFHQRFLDGAVEKGIRFNVAEEIWELMAGFAKYGFSKNHATAYSIISYQCAWLWTKFPSEWAAAFLDKEPEKRKEKAINIAKSLGYTIRKADVNYSSFVWEIDPDDAMVLVQPLSSLKGLGDAAIQQIVDNRPFSNIEEFLFHDDIVYSKLNKKALDVLCRSGALNSLMDDRFTGRKHFWSAVAVERVYNRKKFNENIENYQDEVDFSVEEEIDNLTTLTGIFPMHLVMTEEVRRRLEANYVPALSDYDPDLGLVWFIPREIIRKKTKNGKPYWIVVAIDSNSVLTKFRCWGIIEGKDRIHLNRPYMMSPQYDPVWGFSVRSIRKQLRLLA